MNTAKFIIYTMKDQTRAGFSKLDFADDQLFSTLLYVG